MESFTGSATLTIPASPPSSVTNITVSPSSRRSLAVSVSASTSSPRSCASFRLPIATAVPSTVPLTPLPVTASKSVASASVTPRSSAPRTIAAASGCSEPFSSVAASFSTVASSWPVAGRTATSWGSPFVNVPVLSTMSVSTASNRSRDSAFLMSTPHLSAAPRRRHDRHRGRETQCAGTRDDQDRNRRQQRVGQRGRGAPDCPDDERADRDRDHHGHEQARHLVGVSLDGRPAPLRVLDHLDDLAQHRAGADSSSLHDQAAGAVDGRAGERIARRLLHGYRLARDHALVDEGAAVDHHAVDRHLGARPHPQPVAELHVVERDLFLPSVLADYECGLGRHVEQRADCPAGALAGAELHELT